MADSVGSIILKNPATDGCLQPTFMTKSERCY